MTPDPARGDAEPDSLRPGSRREPENAIGGAAAAEADSDGPLSEADALLALTNGTEDKAEWAATAQAAKIADLIAQHLQNDASGLNIGTLALFHDTVSFGGGFNAHGSSGGAARPAPSSPWVELDTEEQARFLSAYLPPSGYSEALERLSGRHLLVLAAAPGTGREAAAVNLLAEALIDAGAEDGGVCHWATDPSTVLQPGWHPPTGSAGYLLVLDDSASDAGSSYQALDPGWLRATAIALRESNSFMAVVTGTPRGVLALSAEQTQFVHPAIGTVDVVAVLERHALGPEPEPEQLSRLRRLLEDSRALAALRERPEPATAVRLAQAITAGRDLAEEVALVRDPTVQVHRWFSRHENLEALCFAIAAAVLEESSYLTVADAAVQLHAALSPDGTAPTGLRYRDRLADDHPWIEVVRAAGATGLPTGPPLVRFRSPLVRQAVLGYAWTCLDGFRSGLVTWMRRLLTHSDVEVRARAAVAGGVMAWGDHQHALHRYVSSWAGSTVWPVRQAAATALGVIAGQPELVEDVWSKLTDWASSGSSAFDRRQANTAATAVGGLLGRREPIRAMAVLRDALDWRDDWGNLVPVAWSVVRLVDQGQARPVLSALLEWSQPQDLSPMVAKSLSAFLFTVNRTHPTTSAGGRPGAAQPLPGLWVDARELAPELEELWARSLARRPIQDQALVALRAWLDECGERDPAGLPAVRRILAGIADRPGKHRDRLMFYLEKWAKDPDGPSTVSAGLQLSLSVPRH